ncbi:MAG: long-chain fatty acid--CoA ligase [Bacteroidales bacterium]|nr:long-chain fatty acid--CoA ligase [Bacteroidales bacterium]
MEIRRTFDIVDQLVEKYQRDDALAVKRNGQWEKFSTLQYKEFVDDFSCGLLAAGFKKGDKILTVSNNRPEWNFVDMGMSQVGVVHVPIYPNNGAKEYQHILVHSDARIIIVSSQEYYDLLSMHAETAPNIEKIYSFDQLDGVPNWSEFVELGKKNREKFKDELKTIRDSIQPRDLMSIIYTSGTTGLSKGVMLCHENFVSNVLATRNILPITGTEFFLSFLPLCHVLERMVNYLVQSNGAGVYYAESIDTLGENMREVSPHGFTSVPRVLEKIFDKILLKGKELTGIKKSLFFWAVNLGLKYELNKANGWWYEFQLKLANKIIFNKWREATGGRIKVIISGGAALQERLARIFHAARIPVMEGYGLTETSPVISVNFPYYPKLKFGSVGPILDNIDVKIAEDGEILMKGPSLMLGYYKDEEKTKEVIDDEGYFHTGDIGEIGEYNILKITDRKKEIFKLSTGKYIAPQVVENRFKESQFIEQIMVVGEGEKFAGAIICPSFEFLHGWCFKNGITYRDNKDLIQIPEVIARFQQEVDTINKGLGNYRQVKKFELTCQEWLTETGELSPTLKVKRKFLKVKYKVKLDRMYGYTDADGYVGTPSNQVTED